MKLSLRKASAIQAIINEQINEPFSGSITIGKYDDAAKLVGEGVKNFAEVIEKKHSLIAALYFIRDSVAIASSASGVSSILAELARLSKEDQFAKQLAATGAFIPSGAVIAEAIADIKKEPTQYTSRKDSISISIVSKEIVENAKKQLLNIRKDKQKLSDKLLHLNVTTEISLNDNIEAILKKYDVI